MLSRTHSLLSCIQCSAQHTELSTECSADFSQHTSAGARPLLPIRLHSTVQALLRSVLLWLVCDVAARAAQSLLSGSYLKAWWMVFFFFFFFFVITIAYHVCATCMLVAGATMRAWGPQAVQFCSKHPDQAAVTMKSLCPKCMSEIDAKALNITLVELLPCGSRGAVRRSMCHAL